MNAVISYSITDKETGEITVLTEEELATKRQETLTLWYAALKEAEVAKLIVANEQLIRKSVAAIFFLEPEEGTNTYDLEQGWKLKLTHRINRKVDEAVLDSVKVQLKELNINMDTLVSYSPKLETKTYKGLKKVNPDAAKVFEQALIIKDESPTLELLPPKASK
jgi:hypothetical protein